ncbi:MAG: ABC transporter transmembrane domain-containing protein, partial [Gammaproteobacteria bacterium]|nr:ABC transporter transmembrane domain-containing protein [Gammaproteobacteria bacterium]
MNDKTEQRPLGRDLQPLKRLLSFVMPYQRTLLAAMLTLLLAAAATLSLPVAVRYMIDNGFGDTGAVDRYFLILLALAMFMAITSAIRHYLVSWLGERVVTDLRASVYARVVRLDP